MPYNHEKQPETEKNIHLWSDRQLLRKIDGQMIMNDISTGSILHNIYFVLEKSRVSVQGVKSLGGHFACLCRGFEFYEVKKKKLLFFKKKKEILLHF